MIQVDNNEIILKVHTSLYSKNAIFKCLYWYTDRFNINIDISEKHYIIKLKAIDPAIDKDKLGNYLIKLEKDLIDFNLRDIVTKETQNIRDLLIAKAFSNFDTDEIPPEVNT